MKCPKCGIEVLDEAVFCSKCGNKFETSAEAPKPDSTKGCMQGVILIVAIVAIIAGMMGMCAH